MLVHSGAPKNTRSIKRQHFSNFSRKATTGDAKFSPTEFHRQKFLKSQQAIGHIDLLCLHTLTYVKHMYTGSLQNNARNIFIIFLLYNF